MFSLIKGTVSRGAFWTFNNQSPYLQTFMEPRNRFRQTGNLLLGSLKDLQIRALERYLSTSRTFHFCPNIWMLSRDPVPLTAKNEQNRAPNVTKFSAQVTLKVYIVTVLVIYSKGFISIPLSHLFFSNFLQFSSLRLPFHQYTVCSSSPSPPILPCLFNVHTVHCTYIKALKGPALPGA